MKFIWLFPIALGVLAVSSSYVGHFPASEFTLAQATNQSGVDARIIKIPGEQVMLKKRAEQNYNSVLIKDTPINLGDSLIVKKGQTVVVQCEADKTTWTVPDDNLPWGVSNVCSPSAKSNTK